MKKQDRGPAALRPFSGYASFGGMCWPLPVGEHQSEVRWRLTWGEPTRADLVFAAAVMSAYQQMVYDPEKQRRFVIRSLREMGARQPATAGSASASEGPAADSEKEGT